MERATWIALLAGVLLGLRTAGEDLTFHHTGVYADDFDFCTMSVMKVRYFGEGANPDSLPRYRERLKQNRRAGRPNIVGLYTFDRVKHSRPLEEYIAWTDAVLEAVDVGDIDVVFLSEENVTWNNGLAILNGLYDHIKGRYPELPVYQWLTSPAGPAAKLKADGWLYDHYKHGRASFRKKICEYIATGKPLIMCLNASPDVARFEDPLGGELSREQWEVCREFNLPVFYYCVDLRWGNPFIWWHSNEPQLTAWRNWVVDRVEQAERTDLARLPERSADYTDAASIEAAPDETGRFEWTESFAGADWLSRLTTRGFTNLTWDGINETLSVRRASRHRRYSELFAQVTSEFEMASPQARLELAEPAPAGTVELMLSATGHNWPATVDNADGASGLQVNAEDLGGKAFWLRVRIDAGEQPGQQPAAILQSLHFACAVTPPEQPGVTIAPAQDGTVSYVEDFASSKYSWLAHVSNAETLSWTPGQIATTGVQGRSNRVELRWPVTVSEPIADLRVRMTARANSAHLGSANVLGVSLDGQEPALSATTRELKADRHGWERGDLVLDLTDRPDFTGITSFWIHALMTNGSGVKTNSSNMISKVAFEAQVAKP